MTRFQLGIKTTTTWTLALRLVRTKRYLEKARIYSKSRKRDVGLALSPFKNIVAAPLL